MSRNLSRRNGTLLALGLSLLAALLSIFVKLSLTTGELLPGLDGAYYWVQVRSILNDFTLAFDDLPLVFIAQSGIALLVGDIPTAVRISDAVFPALSAIPLFLMARESRSVLLPAGVILAVLLNPIQLYYFTGDFIKNASAIPLVFMLGWILMIWERANKKLAISGIVLILATLALSHFGTLLMGLLVFGLWSLLQLRNKSRRFWLIGSLATVGFSGAVLVLLAVLVPARFERLISFFADPQSIFAQPVWESLFQGRMDTASSFSVLFGQLACVVLGFVFWRSRSALSFSDKSLVVATILSALVLSSPLLGMEWSGRLSAMAFVPIAIAGLVLWRASEGKAGRLVIATLAAITLVASAMMSVSGGRGPVLDAAQYQDFLQLKAEYSLPSGSLIVASHGMEFLSAWELETSVVQDSFFSDTNQDSYEAIYVLSSLKNATGPGNGSVPSGSVGNSAGGQAAGAPPADGQRPPAPGAGKPADGQGAPGVASDQTPPPDVGGGVDQNSALWSQQQSGETVYENDSFQLIKIK